jgi:hypothetical protein
MGSIWTLCESAKRNEQFTFLPQKNSNNNNKQILVPFQTRHCYCIHRRRLSFGKHGRSTQRTAHLHAQVSNGSIVVFWEEYSRPNVLCQTTSNHDHHKHTLHPRQAWAFSRKRVGPSAQWPYTAPHHHRVYDSVVVSSLTCLFRFLPLRINGSVMRSKHSVHQASIDL